MALSESARKRRVKHIGSSDIAAVMGLNVWSSPHDIWMAKKFPSKEQPSKGSAIRRGDLFESPLIDHAAGVLGVKVKKNQFRVCRAHPVFAAQIDALAIGRTEGIEAKTTSLYRMWENGVPDHVVMQCQHQMLCADLAHMTVVADVPNIYFNEDAEPELRMEIKLFGVERDERIVQAIIKYGEQWWNKYVIGNKEPKITRPPREESYKYILREADKIVTIRGTLVKRWDSLKKRHNRLGRILKNARGCIIAKLGDAEVGQLTGTDEYVTYYANQKESRTLKYPGKPYRRETP